MSLKIENVKKEHLKVLQLTEEREGKIGSFSTIISRRSEGGGLILAVSHNICASSLWLPILTIYQEGVVKLIKIRLST